MISNDRIVKFKHIRRINPVFLSTCEQVKNLLQHYCSEFYPAMADWKKILPRLSSVFKDVAIISLHLVRTDTSPLTGGIETTVFLL